MLDLSLVTSAFHDNKPQPHRNLDNIGKESRWESRVYGLTPLKAKAADKKTDRKPSGRVKKIFDVLNLLRVDESRVSMSSQIYQPNIDLMTLIPGASWK